MIFSYKQTIYKLNKEQYLIASDIRDSLGTLTLGDALEEVKNMQ